MGDVVDRRFGRTVEPRSGLTTSKIIERMKKLIDERVRDEGAKGRIAPHHLILKVEWGTHSEAPPEILRSEERRVGKKLTLQVPTRGYKHDIHFTENRYERKRYRE